jgi:hypothetical protein
MSKPDSDTDVVAPDSVDAVVRTRSLRDGHFRAGCKHETEAVDWPPGTFTDAQLDQLRDDPDLEVDVLEDFSFDDDQDKDDKGQAKDRGRSK